MYEDPEWPQFGAGPNKRMNFNLQPAVVDDFRTEECTYWRTIYSLL